MCIKCKETQKFWSLLFFFSVIVFMLAGLWAWYSSEKELNMLCSKLYFEKERNSKLTEKLDYLEGALREIEYFSKMEPSFETFDAKTGGKLSKNLKIEAVFDRLETRSRYCE